ncbi:MAG: hypothetical protein HY472_00035 [Candidatus Sungbacteria bacterium]|nr:hypothetical protein [Candidatus Sungbacteria bacterium]
MRVFIGIILVLAGFLLVWKTPAIVSFTGHSAWAEKWLGTEGGTYLMYKLIGILLVFAGLMAVTNLHTAFLNATLGTLFSPRI